MSNPTGCRRTGPRTRARDARLDRTLMLLVALSLFAFYVAVQRGEFVGWDGRIMAGVARNLWQHGQLQKFGDSFGGDPHRELSGAWSEYGIGMSLLLAPLWGLQLRVNPNDAQWLTVANPLVLAATGALLYRIGAELGWRRSTAVGAALVFGMLTMAPFYSTELFSEPAVTLGTVAVVLGLLRWRGEQPSGPWLVGVGTGWSILFRTDAIVLVGAALLAIPLFVPWTRLWRPWRTWTAALAVPIGGALVWLGYYNALRTGSPLTYSYAGVSFTTPLLDGLQRQLWSTGKGFFWYDPILLFALPGIAYLWRRDRPLGMLIVGLATLRVITYAKWAYPDGTVAWGPRFLLPWCALLVVPLGELWEAAYSWKDRQRTIARSAIAVLAALSAVVVVASVWVPYTQYWGEVNDPTGIPPERMAVVAAERTDDAFNKLSSSPLVVNLRELDRARPFPLRWLRGGPTLLGLIAILIAIAGTSLALTGAAVADDRGREPTRGASPLTGPTGSPEVRRSNP